MNQARAVWPVLNLAGSGDAPTASAMILLRSVSARSSASLLGRLKKTRDQRSNGAWAFGGGLSVHVSGEQIMKEKGLTQRGGDSSGGFRR